MPIEIFEGGGRGGGVDTIITRKKRSQSFNFKPMIYKMCLNKVDYLQDSDSRHPTHRTISVLSDIVSSPMETEGDFVLLI